MFRFLARAALFAAAAVAVMIPLTSQSEAGKRARQAERPVLKDCTRMNGRFGYYGNPWCTPAEQKAWDRATSRR
jgi:curli biogenesis system outer membrane secretion channel CsgG